MTLWITKGCTMYSTLSAQSSVASQCTHSQDVTYSFLFVLLFIEDATEQNTKTENQSNSNLLKVEKIWTVSIHKVVRKTKAHGKRLQEGIKSGTTEKSKEHGFTPKYFGLLQCQLRKKELPSQEPFGSREILVVLQKSSLNGQWWRTEAHESSERLCNWNPNPLSLLEPIGLRNFLHWLKYLH